MKTKSVGFIGGGRITRIFLQAFANRNTAFKSIIVFDTNAEVLNALKNQFPQITIAETLQQTASQQLVFIALHPPMIMETLDKIADAVSTDTLLVSLAPKSPLKR